MCGAAFQSWEREEPYVSQKINFVLLYEVQKIAEAG